jgi:hypothetical protein
MSAAGWFIVLLALAGANLPFLNQRLFAVAPLKAVKKSAWLRIAELIVLYFVVGAFGCFWCSRFPALPSSISSNGADGSSRRAPRCPEVAHG